MKKGFLLLLVLCLMIASISTTYAESVDLSNYDDSELLALLDQVQSEIVARHIEKVAQLPAGTYVGGKDIPAGTYVLTSNGNEKDSGIVSLRSVNDDPDRYPSKLYEFVKSVNNYTVYITMEDGDTLILPYAFTLTISGGVVFR